MDSGRLFTSLSAQFVVFFCLLKLHVMDATTVKY